MHFRQDFCLRAKPAKPCYSSLSAMSRVSLTFLWETPARAIPVFSVFIPFFGCPRRCVFCSQHDQTGQQASPLDEILARAAADLHARRAQGRPPVELAFYGGTFTALAPRDLDACLDMADSLRRDGCITRFRCSTRPDRLDAALLARLRRHGCRTVELGIQSFSDTALQASERHYSGRQATEACRLVRDAGLALGVQLLPGMPGHQPEDFLADVRRALDLGADMLRFYPCLVLAGTELARPLAAGPLRALAPAADPVPAGARLAVRRRAGVPVIRMGLAPEPGMEAALLAGPADRNLGGRVLGRALWLHVCACLLRTRGDDAARSEVRAAALLDALLAGGKAPAGLPRHRRCTCRAPVRDSSAGRATSWARPGRPWASRAATLSGQRDRPPACILMPDPIFPPTCGTARIRP